MLRATKAAGLGDAQVARGNAQGAGPAGEISVFRQDLAAPPIGRRTPRCDLVHRSPRAPTHPNGMHICTICDRAIEGPGLRDCETSGTFDAACVAQQLPEDLVVVLVALAASVLVPAVMVWAG